MRHAVEAKAAAHRDYLVAQQAQAGELNVTARATETAAKEVIAQTRTAQQQQTDNAAAVTRLEQQARLLRAQREAASTATESSLLAELESVHRQVDEVNAERDATQKRSEAAAVAKHTAHAAALQSKLDQVTAKLHAVCNGGGANEKSDDGSNRHEDNDRDDDDNQKGTGEDADDDRGCGGDNSRRTLRGRVTGVKPSKLLNAKKVSCVQSTVVVATVTGRATLWRLS